MTSAALDLKNKIDGVVEISFGKTITTNRAKGHTHGLRVLIAKSDKLDFYRTHPAHVEFAGKAKSFYVDQNDTPTVLDWVRDE